jgi:hypothetical protein
LDNPAAEEGALLALERLPARQAADRLARYVDRRMTASVHYEILWRDVEPQAQDDRTRLMADALRDSARQQAINAMRAIGLVSDRVAIFLALEGLQSRDASQRANALEALEATRERDRLRPFLVLWEPVDPDRVVVPLDQHLVDLLDSEPDPWIRASAALAAGHVPDPQVRAALERRAADDPDELVSTTAQSSLGGPVDTLATLSVMERILFLRRVPLFGDLAPADLKQVAALAAEQAFTDGEVIAEQGEAGEEMFVIVAGEVRVLVGGAEVARRGRGDIVGEMAIISQEPRVATLAAAGEVRTLCLDRPSFEGLLRERPDVSLAVMRVLCARLREATR